MDRQTKFTNTTFMWSSLRLAPISYCSNLSFYAANGNKFLNCIEPVIQATTGTYTIPGWSGWYLNCIKELLVCMITSYYLCHRVNGLQKIHVHICHVYTFVCILSSCIITIGISLKHYRFRVQLKVYICKG